MEDSNLVSVRPTHRHRASLRHLSHLRCVRSLVLSPDSDSLLRLDSCGSDDRACIHRGRACTSTSAKELNGSLGGSCGRGRALAPDFPPVQQPSLKSPNSCAGSGFNWKLVCAATQAAGISPWRLPGTVHRRASTNSAANNGLSPLIRSRAEAVALSKTRCRLACALPGKLDLH